MSAIPIDLVSSKESCGAGRRRGRRSYHSTILPLSSKEAGNTNTDPMAGVSFVVEQELTFGHLGHTVPLYISINNPGIRGRTNVRGTTQGESVLVRNWK